MEVPQGPGKGDGGDVGRGDGDVPLHHLELDLVLVDLFPRNQLSGLGVLLLEMHLYH